MENCIITIYTRLSMYPNAYILCLQLTEFSQTHLCNQHSDKTALAGPRKPPACSFPWPWLVAACSNTGGSDLGLSLCSCWAPNFWCFVPRWNQRIRSFVQAHLNKHSFDLGSKPWSHGFQTFGFSTSSHSLKIITSYCLCGLYLMLYPELEIQTGSIREFIKNNLIIY